jgi:glycosyltransferase involved in cell wall biosynthesis
LRLPRNRKACTPKVGFFTPGYLPHEHVVTELLRHGFEEVIRRPAVREVCGDVPLYFDPRRPEELALRLRKVFADPALRAWMSSNGLERARFYSWMESARLNLQVIRDALCSA